MEEGKKENQIPEFRFWSNRDFSPAGVLRGSWHQYFLITPEAQTLAEKSCNVLDLYQDKVRDTLGKIFKCGDKTHAGWNEDLENGADSSQGSYLFLSYPSLCLTVTVWQADLFQSDRGQGIHLFWTSSQVWCVLTLGRSHIWSESPLGN